MQKLTCIVFKDSVYVIHFCYVCTLELVYKHGELLFFY